MVHVPVDNRHLFETVFLLRVARRERDIVEDAKPHAARRGGMMTGRTHCTENRLIETRDEGIHRIEHPAGCVTSRPQRRRTAHVGVARTQHRDPSFNLSHGGGHIGRGVHQTQFLQRRLPGGDTGRGLPNPVFFQLGTHGLEAGRAFGMPVPGQVEQARFIEQQRGGHEE